MMRADRILGRATRAATILTMLAVVACGAPPSGKGGSGDAPGTEGAGLPRPAPDFALQDLAGKTVRLSDSAGKLRLVDFWATWCAPCREEVPGFKELHAQYRDKGLEIIAISMDDNENGEGQKQVKAFVDKNQIPYVNLMGDDKTAEAFGGVLGLPTAFLIDGEGKIVATWVGGVPKRVFEQKVRETLGIGPA